MGSHIDQPVNPTPLNTSMPSRRPEIGPDQLVNIINPAPDNDVPPSVEKPKAPPVRDNGFDRIRAISRQLKEFSSQANHAAQELNNLLESLEIDPQRNLQYIYPDEKEELKNIAKETAPEMASLNEIITELDALESTIGINPLATLRSAERRLQDGQLAAKISRMAVQLKGLYDRILKRHKEIAADVFEKEAWKLTFSHPEEITNRISKLADVLSQCASVIGKLVSQIISFIT
jgi:DNA repair ATPase RecN